MATWQEHSLKVAPQVSGFGTPATQDADFVAILGELPAVQFATDIEELKLMTGQVGAAPERLPGARSGTIKFKIPLEGLKTAYDPTAENPGDTGVVPPWFAMVANVMGSYIANSDTAAKFWKAIHASVSEYTGAGVASATTSAITCDNATASDKVSVGELIVTALSATTTTLQWGFVKTKAGQVLTLFETSANAVNDNAANIYGTATAWISAAHGSQLPMTFRWVGEDTTSAYILSDAVCDGFTLTWESGKVSSIEFSYKFHDYTRDKTKGGLAVPTGYKRTPQIVGNNNGRATIAGAVKCGLEDCKIEYKTELTLTRCHSAAQGISAVSYRNPRIKVTVSIPHNTADAVYDAAGNAGNTGSHLWQSYLERGVSMSIGAGVGSQVGRFFAFMVTNGYLVNVPQVQTRDGAVVGYQLEIEAGAYTGDTTDTAETSTNSPIDSPFKMAIA